MLWTSTTLFDCEGETKQKKNYNLQDELDNAMGEDTNINVDVSVVPVVTVLLLVGVKKLPYKYLKLLIHTFCVDLNFY